MKTAKLTQLETLQPLTHVKLVKSNNTAIVCEHPIQYYKNERFTAPLQIARMFRDMKDETKEHFCCLHLDGKNRIVCYDVVSTGSLNQSIVHPREVFKTACMVSAAAIILLHNHPSGDPSPSREDREITRRLKECGEIIGIRVLDHIIVGDGDSSAPYFSFVESGLM